MLGAAMYFLIWIILQPVRLLTRWQVSGLENLPARPQGFVLATNHIHYLDILVLGASLPLRYQPWWLAKSELFENRLAAWWFRVMRVIPVTRGRRDMSAMHAAEDSLTKHGAVLVIFTEGTRSKNGVLQEGRGGAIRLAVRTKTPILPLAIDGTQHSIGTLLLRRAAINIRIGQPYHPAVTGESIPYNRMSELVEEMMLQIATLLPAEQQGFYREKLLNARAPEPALPPIDGNG
jgi:1-acyl-sn-glycerol-3-phosphate acyltransferase